MTNEEKLEIKVETLKEVILMLAEESGKIEAGAECKMIVKSSGDVNINGSLTV